MKTGLQSSKESARTPVSFDSLPNEIVLIILKSIESLSTLASVTRVSHQARQVFHAYARQIIHSVLYHVPAEIRAIMVAVLRIRVEEFEGRSYNYTQKLAVVNPSRIYREPSPTPSDQEETQPFNPPRKKRRIISDFQRWHQYGYPRNYRHTFPGQDLRSAHMNDHWPYHTTSAGDLQEQRYQSEGINAILPVPKEISSNLLLKFTHLADNIHRLAHACLDKSLETFIAAQPFEWQPADGKPVATWSVSWVEEHKALMGLWRVQLFFELQQARVHKRLSWSTDALKQLRNTAVAEFYCRRTGFSSSLAYSMYIILKSLGIEAEAAIARFRMPDSNIMATVPFQCSPNLWPRDGDDERAEAEEQVSRIAKRRRSGKSCGSRYSRMFVHGYLPGLEEEEDGHWLSLHDATLGHQFTDTWYHNSQIDVPEHLPYTTFYRLGLMIWDEKRLLQTGLWDVETGEDVNECLADMARYYKRWLTLIPPGNR